MYRTPLSEYDHGKRRCAGIASHPIRIGLVAGIVSGLALGAFLKATQAATGSKVYTLLLNVDFVPFLPQPLPEWFEFALHLLFSIGIALVYTAVVTRFPATRRRAFALGVAAGLAAAPLYFPLAALSDRVPAIDDLEAFFWWTAGHLLYGILLGLLGRKFARGWGPCS